MSPRAVAPEELAAERAAEQAAVQKAALRRQQTQDRLKAEASASAAQQRARERNEARLAEMRFEAPAEARRPLREEAADSELAAEKPQPAREPEPAPRAPKAQAADPKRTPGRQEDIAASNRRDETAPTRRAAPTPRLQEEAEQEVRRKPRQPENSQKSQADAARKAEPRRAAKTETATTEVAKTVAAKTGAAKTGRTSPLGRRRAALEEEEPRRPLRDEATPSAKRPSVVEPADITGSKPKARQRSDDEEQAASTIAVGDDARRSLEAAVAAQQRQEAEQRDAVRRQQRADRMQQIAEQRLPVSAPGPRRPEEAVPRKTAAEAAPRSTNAASRASSRNDEDSEQPTATPAGIRRFSFSPRGVLPIAPRAAAPPAATVSTALQPHITDALDATVSSAPAGATVPSPSIIPVPMAALSRLSTSGAFVVDENKTAVSLRGATVIGFDTVAAGEDTPTALSLDETNISLMRDVWGLNLVRIPFLAQSVLSGNGAVAAVDLLAGLDAAISIVSQAGLYVLLAMSAPAAATGTAPSPDASATQAWQTLAARYKGNNAVLYELFASTAPLDPTWPQEAAILIGTIRREAQAALIFVGGGKGGSDVSQLPLLFPTGDPIFNIVYTIDVSAATDAPDSGALSALAECYPVFASTWSEPDDGRIGPYIADIFGRYGIGFAAANWNAAPNLIVDAANHDFTATAWGLVASRAAAAPVRPMRQPFSYATAGRGR